MRSIGRSPFGLDGMLVPMIQVYAAAVANVTPGKASY
jgi:hypothetical protein